MQKYGPERVIDTPITEAGFTGMAVGSGDTRSRLVASFVGQHTHEPYEPAPLR